MRVLGKIFAAVISAMMLAQTFVMCAIADSVPSVNYTFAGTEQGIADGTIIVSGIPSDAKKVRLYWGSSENTALTNYSDIKIYTSAADIQYNEEAIPSGGELTYTVEGSRYLPEAAKYIVAEIVNSDDTVTTVSQPLTNTGFSSSDMLYSMFWVSDVHIQWRSYKDTSNQSKAFRIMREIADADNGKFKGIIMNGDLADSAYDYEYEMLASMIDKTFGEDYPVYYNIGNHDQYKTDNFNVAFDKYLDRMEKMGYTFAKTHKWSYDTYINGQHYIFWATPNGTSKYKEWWAGESDYEWLEAKLSEGDKAGAKNYVFTHLSARGTTTGSDSKSSFNDEDDVEFEAIMARHPHTVVVTSHYHLDMDTDMTTLIANKNTPSYMDTSSLYYTSTYIPEYKSEMSHAYGRYVQIYDDKLVVKTMNFKENKWVPRAEHIIPVDNSVKFDGTVSVSNSGEGLATGNVLTAKLDGNDVDTSKYDCEWFVSGTGSVGTGATYTIATADKNVSLKLTDKETGAYAYATTGYFSYTEEEEEEDDSQTTLTPPTMDNDNTVVENDGTIMVSGNVGTSNAGKSIMLVIAPKASYDDASTFKYINEVTVKSDGSYVFKFKADNVSEDDFLIAKLDGNNVTNSVINVKGSNEFGVEMTMSLDSSNKPVLSITNKYMDTTENVKIIIATYNSDKRLLDAKIVDWDMLFGAYGEVQKYTAAAVEGASVKAFLFRDLETIEPLSASAFQNIATAME